MSKIEVDEVLGLVSDEGAEVTAYDTVPGRAFALIELCCVSCGLDEVGFGDWRVVRGEVWGGQGSRTVFLMYIAMSFSIVYLIIASCAGKVLAGLSLVAEEREGVATQPPGYPTHQYQ